MTDASDPPVSLELPRFSRQLVAISEAHEGELCLCAVCRAGLLAALAHDLVGQSGEARDATTYETRAIVELIGASSVIAAVSNHPFCEEDLHTTVRETFQSAQFRAAPPMGSA